MSHPSSQPPDAPFLGPQCPCGLAVYFSRRMDHSPFANRDECFSVLRSMSSFSLETSFTSSSNDGFSSPHSGSCSNMILEKRSMALLSCYPWSFSFTIPMAARIEIIYLLSPVLEVKLHESREPCLVHWLSVSGAEPTI